MKHMIYSIAFGVLLVSCKNDTFDKLKQMQQSIGNAVEGAKNLSNYDDVIEDTKERVEELSTMTPVTKQEFSSWMKEDVKGFKRTAYSIQKMPVTTISLTYKSSDNEEVEVTIMDCAGKEGATLYATQGMFSGLYGSMESETETETQEVKERDGKKSYEVYDKISNHSSISTTIDERFIVNLKAENMTTDQAYSFLEALDIDDLD